MNEKTNTKNESDFYQLAIIHLSLKQVIGSNHRKLLLLLFKWNVILYGKEISYDELHWKGNVSGHKCNLMRQ